MYRDLTAVELPGNFVQGVEALRCALMEAGPAALEPPSGSLDLEPEQVRARVAKGALEDLEWEGEPRAVVRHAKDSFHIRFKKWLKKSGYYEDGPVWDAVRGLMSEPEWSGFYWYPPGGFMGWHTNENRPGPRLYATWAREGHRSFLRYRVPGSTEIRTSWDEDGWTFRWFDAGDEDETRFWHCVYSETDRISFGFRSDVEHVLRGVHTLRGEWALDGLPPLPGNNHYVIRLARLREVIAGQSPQNLPFAQISHKRMTDPDYRDRSKRFARCNPCYPGIVVEHMSNPDGRRYRMIDGKHRIHRQIDAGRTAGWFYVLQVDQVQDLIEPRY